MRTPMMGTAVWTIMGLTMGVPVVGLSYIIGLGDFDWLSAGCMGGLAWLLYHVGHIFITLPPSKPGNRWQELP